MKTLDPILNLRSERTFVTFHAFKISSTTKIHLSLPFLLHFLDIGLAEAHHEGAKEQRLHFKIQWFQEKHVTILNSGGKSFCTILTGFVFEIFTHFLKMRGWRWYAWANNSYLSQDGRLLKRLRKSLTNFFDVKFQGNGFEFDVNGNDF